MTWRTMPCGSCGAPVIWAVTVHGRRMPVDADPTADGNIRLDDTSPPTAVIVGPEPHSGGTAPPTLRKSHFATCPNAAQHRRR